ncbi:MAG: discoidin domain-containing protein [Lachnospiraceae bacterium]|nr:discoidin domain-containing protein [Lachnospiraceae bacterium]
MFRGKKALAILLGATMLLSTAAGDIKVYAAGTEQVVAASGKGSANEGQIRLTEQGLEIGWDAIENASEYDVYHSASRYGTYTKLATVKGTTYTDTAVGGDKYAHYYKVAKAGSGELSAPISLEISMFGEDMYIFSPNDDVEQVYQAVNDIYLIQGSVDGNGDAHEGQQFGSGRYTFAFKTGDYTGMQADQFDISYYMQLIGLGKVPTDVKLKNVHVPPVLPAWNVTCNFWMDIENLEIAEESVYGSTDTWYNFMWSVSQAAPARRLSVKRPASLNFMWDGWSSGGYIADSVFAQPVGSWTQQQYYIRNSELNNNFYGVNWNMVAQGTKGITVTDQNHPLYALESGVGQTNWRSGGKYTLIDSTDVIREKPFLYFDESVKEYKVFVPALRENAKGVSWFRTNMGQGTSLNISDFYIARADKDNGASINQALKEGKHILLSPGIYYAEEPIHVEKANTVILGLGLATIIPTNNETAIKIDDVGGVTVAGVILDADSYSKNMLVVGEEGCNKNHASNPTVLQDLFVRIGGVHGGVASTDQAVVINSNDVIGDDFWIWRADHGQGVGWNLNKAKNGVVVNGANVTMYGLMVEHFQEYDVLWRGENGKTYFLQNEKCYDPQNQADWMSHEGTVKGFAAYKVANCVKNHYAVGLGSYDVFINTNGASIFMDNAIEVPDTAGVRIENACTVEIANADGPYVGFNHIVNGTGAAITNGVGGQGYARQALLSYNNKKALVLEDYYQAGGNDSGVVLEEMGVTPTDDPAAEKNITKEEPSDDPEKPIEEEAPDVYAGLGLNFAEGSVAEGAYADWKNNAITYPSKGGLVAAGYIDAAFGKLAGAIQYEVYVDGRLIETISGTDAQAAEYQVEFYSVEVAKHTIYVVATLENNDKVTSNVRAFYVSKKGMGIWQDDADKIEELNLSWYYTWSPYELNGVDKDVDFVPMVWGDEADTRSVDRVNEWKWLRAGNWRNYRYLLTFNEPDFTDQSHMTPERAVELWREIEPICDEPSIDVSSPVVAIPTVFYPDTNNDYNTVGGWYGKYDQLMATAEYHDEFTAVHFYFDYPGEWILDTLEQIHETTNKPLWITEWGVGQWSQVQDFDWTGGPDEGNWQRSLIVDFMKDVIPQIDQLPYVERYAWFPFDGSNTDKYGNGAGGLFYCGSNDPLKGQLTAAGKAYKQVGNPAGWEAGAITEDKVVVDQLSGGEEEEKPPVLEGERRNVVKGKNITASTELGGNVAANAVDCNEGSRWESVHNQEDAEWLAVDLGGTYIIDSFKVIWENAAAKEYQIQVSNDGENWTDVYTVTDGRNAETRTGSFDAVSARFVRLYGTVKTMAIYGYSLYEWEVYGVEQEQDTPPTEQPGEEEAELPVITEHSNVAAGKVISASTELGGNVAANAIDGNTASRWESVQGKEDAEWIEINLGGMYAIDSFKAVWENAAAKEYQIQVSTDGSSWKSVYTVTDGKSGETRSESFDAVLASYIRLYGTVKTMPVYGYSLYELEIYGEKQNTGAEHSNPGEDTQPGEDTSTKEHFNVAAGKTITASTELGGNVAANAVDGNPTSRWESVQGKEDAEWLLIDLGDTYTVDSFKLTWENASAAKYTIEVSADGNEWKTVYAVNNGVSGETREDSFAAASARYVRLNGTSKTMAIYGYSLYEFEVYAVK